MRRNFYSIWINQNIKFCIPPKLFGSLHTSTGKISNQSDFDQKNKITQYDPKKFILVPYKQQLPMIKNKIFYNNFFKF